MFITQISVYLENNKGTLRTLTKTLAESDIDIIALSVADTTHFGIIRIVIREADVEKGIMALRNNGFMAKVNHVFCAAVPNQPAGLDSLLAIIEESNFSIEYIYSLNYIIGNKALIVLRLSADGMEKEDIGNLLIEKGVILVKQDEINRL